MNKKYKYKIKYTCKYKYMYASVYLYQGPVGEVAIKNRIAESPYIDGDLFFELGAHGPGRCSIWTRRTHTHPDTVS